jgi:hypothetical protein
MATTKRRRAPAERKTHKQLREDLEKIEARLADWLREDRLRRLEEAFDEKKTAAVRAAQRLAMNYLGSVGVLDDWDGSGRAPFGPGSGWPSCADMPLASGMGRPPDAYRKAIEAVLYRGGFSPKEIAALTDPRGQKRVDERLRSVPGLVRRGRGGRADTFLG